MKIESATFVISNTDVKKCPSGTKPEYAFIGRSNVGKSSLINMLTGKNGLAMTSATPGKTMLINHFLIKFGTQVILNMLMAVKTTRDQIYGPHILKILACHNIEV